MANLFPFFFFIFLFGTLQLAGVDGESEFNYTYSLTTDVCLLGNAAAGSTGEIPYIFLTPWSNPRTEMWAWATYNKAVPLWMHSASSRALANFSSVFSFDVYPNLATGYGGGLTFFMSPFDLQPPSNGEGQWLGLFNQTSDGQISNQIVAVEFDTFMNSPFDMDSSHVGIDVNSIVSKVNVSVAHLSERTRWRAWVDYDGVAKKLQLYISNETYFTWFSKARKPKTPILSYEIDLSEYLPQMVKIGFSASREPGSTEFYDVFDWNFCSQYSWEIETHSELQRYRIRNVVLLVSGAVVVCLVLVILARWRHGSTNYNLKSRELDKHFAQGPQKYSYSLLRAATNNFSNDEMLGKGGFGQVYRGTLSSSNETVAVKRISEGSNQGEKEYISEVSIISKLRHRNLVQLYGWCHEKGQFLLVYEYLPNGSLDKYLFGDQTKGDLNWERRYSIICDIASALLYLHEEWDHRVVHRDIKASNVMLDGEFTAKLGDFGLARVVERGRAASDTTMVAGTCGYVAPECFVTRKASSESDVFSFGAVCLEIGCGRKAVDQSLEDHNWRLVEWVWDLYGKGMIGDAADAKLGGVFNGEEMERVLLVGLSCSHPDPRARMSIRQVIDILKMKSTILPLPPSYPETVYGATSHDPISALSSMSDGKFCTAENA